ncbi:protein turtle homolog B isoform X1 [Euwallacea fornicatus]|uniref:protein turtle homolog B isoform X1 n=2 Tax=Euwallacea fornicatus TaxID=995702 RepID=UPI00338ECF6A
MYFTLGSVLCLISIALNVKAATIKKLSVDIGNNLTIKCPLLNSRDVMWEREGKVQSHNLKMTVLVNGSLYLQEVEKSDSGIYNCIRENDVKDIKGKVNVTVKSPPSPLIISIKPATVLVLLVWEVNGTGGYPIINFTAQYRLAITNSTWIPVSPNHIPPNARQVEIFSLKPNTTYEFRMWATNQLGRSPLVYVLGTTRGQYSEAELARHFFKGAEHFDTRWWAVAVGVVMGALILLGLGTCVLLYQECRMSPNVVEEPEIIELLPNIILNPGFEGPSHRSDITPDENWNNENPVRLNNNTIVQPQDL